MKPPRLHLWRMEAALGRMAAAVLCLVIAFTVLGGCASPEPKPSGRDTFKIPDSDTEDDKGEGKGGPSVEAWVDPASPRDLVRSLIVGSWNIKWFGRSQPGKYDFVTMADFIEECDVVAVQELQDPNHLACITALLTELTNRGRNYGHRVSDNTGYDDNSDDRKNDYLERYMFLWDENRISLKGTPSFVASPAINNDTYRQVPYVADFEVKGSNGFDFRVLSTHTVYNRRINFVRQAEIQAIHDWMMTTPADGEENLIAIGDFNANPNGQPHHFSNIVQTNDAYRILWYESVERGEETIRTTVPTKNSSSSNPDYLNEPVYDHILVSRETSYALRRAKMTRSSGQLGVNLFDNDPWWAANGWTRPQIIAAVSDHRPVWFKIKFTAADND